MDILLSKREFVTDRIRSYGSVLVALSGGVDSAVLLALSREALGPGLVRAVTATSASLSRHDLEDARRIARSVGVEHELVATGELGIPEYRANQGDRCFHCRNELFRSLRRIANDRGFSEIAYGAIHDDLGDHRPGMRAADVWGIRAPLLEAGLDKHDVRRIARSMHLPVDSKPAAACLASRIPGGTEVTAERLRAVEAAEEALRGLGLGQLRVRHHGEVARIELDPRDLERLADAEMRTRVVRAVKAAGFRFCAIDLEGYRTGSTSRLGAAGGGPARSGGQ